jgi:hypothetical protein
MAANKRSSTYERKDWFYPTPQNQERLKKAVRTTDGQKKEGVSKNKVINEALNRFFSSVGTNFTL